MLQRYRNPDLGSLLVRVALAVVFIAHGWAKAQSIEATIGFFGGLGLHPFFAYLVAAVELVGGLAVLAGVFVGWAGLLLAINMAFAIYLVRFSRGLIGGYEFELTLLLAAASLALTGAGRYALGRREPAER